VLGAAYEIAAASKIGVHLDADRVPVLPETAAICASLGVDPLGLIGSGALLVATPDAARTGGAIVRAGIAAAEIGRFVASDRLLIRESRAMPLAPPTRDELWRILEGMKPAPPAG
jgi:hydrogenase maturation factor